MTDAPRWWVDPAGTVPTPSPEGQPCLFLDRDGVVNIDYGYVHEAARCDFVEGIFGLIGMARDLGFRIVVVTNQAGIGRGYYSEDIFREFTRWMLERLDEAGATTDRVYYCPVHPTAGIGPYRRSHDWRKPRPGMIEAACDHFNLLPGRSMLIGDRLSDIEAGKAAGLGRLLLLASGDAAPKLPENADARTVFSLGEAAVELRRFAATMG